MKCPDCGKFLKQVEATINGLEEIVKVEGRCKAHGIVEPTDWDYDTFYPWPDMTAPASPGGKRDE